MTFQLKDTQFLEDIQTTGYLYEHEQTGAQVLYLQNDDNNKVFTIGFRTPVSSHNGIAHILEHSVLNGSQKFPSKEPFVELLKGSLNTYVNAYTSSDTTIYPVASTNQKDFLNLMEVYLDAVFQPLLHDNPQILAQEGWHYHLEKADEPLIYKGVVYNEMKGANASLDRQLYMAVKKALYPNTHYQYDSGGSPSNIPTLTQEEFTAFHTQYYQPSNALTVLYGNLDKAKAFDLLEEYFGKYNKQSSANVVFEATVPTQLTYADTYSIAPFDEATDKDALVLAWHVGTHDNILDGYGMDVLAELLLGNHESPLKKALLEAEIGKDISGSYFQDGQFGIFEVTAKYSDQAKMSQFKQVVFDTLTKVVADGLDIERVTALLNKSAFQLKESLVSESIPKGLVHMMRSFKTWMYGGNPFEPLHYTHYLNQLYELSTQGYFEQLIEKYLLKNDFQANITLVAQAGKSEAQEQEVFQALQDYKASLSQEEIEAIIQHTHALLDRQNTPDAPELLAKIPRLEKSDLSSDVEDYPLTTHALYEGTQFYHAPQFTSDIDYVSVLFDTKDFALEDYKLLGYLTTVLGQLSTEHYSLTELQTQLDAHTGGVHAQMLLYANEANEPVPYFALRGKALAQSLPNLLRLMKEVLMYTDFTNVSELQFVTQSALAQFDQVIAYESHRLVMGRAQSQVNPIHKIRNVISGIDQFYYLKFVDEQLKVDNGKELVTQLQQLVQRLLNTARIHVLYIGEESRYQEVAQQVRQLFQDVSYEPLPPRTQIELLPLQREAFATSQDVNYVGLATAIPQSFELTGAHSVLMSIVGLDYLWNEVRVKGGAYGSGFVQQRQGEVTLWSYRDPNIERTLEIYQQLPQYVSSLDLENTELTKYIIGAISKFEQPRSAVDKGFEAFSMAQTGYTYAQKCVHKQQVLDTTNAQLVALAHDLRESLSQSAVAVIGNASQIEENKHLFDTIIELA